MDIQYIIDRAKGIIVSPKDEWQAIKGESKSNKELIVFYALPLVVLATLAGLIGHWSLNIAVYQLVMPLLGIVVAAYVANELAEKFNSTKNLNNAFKLVVYAATPSFLASVIANLSFLLSWVSLFGLYSIYLFWVGIPVMMETPDDKRLAYVIVCALVVIVVQLIVSALFAPPMAGIY
ncbi:Yip1 family protein [Fodinibius salsisoli]|uniref:DUF1282 family protein n=1 Tax=Fodinibius salsisoli TaxID=2820877 RepID=A0ABT3PRK7_9BACT|nr:Yip1 family protein [Fodinibius salsisoli]MCW9708504.1 DUF1282 family protein [Fodinibius salsisoli]